MTELLPLPDQEFYGDSILDPILFAENLLGVELFEIQKDLLRSIQFNRKTSIKASNSSGKTRCLAISALWWVACHEEGVCIVTSASALQVNKGILGEIHGLLTNSRFPFPPALQIELKFTARRYIVGFSTTASEREGAARIAGMRSVSGHALVLVDEATGLKNEHFTGIEGILAGGNNTRLVLAGNPTVGAAGEYYYDSFHVNRDQFACFTISAYDTPNLQGLTPESLQQLPDHELDNNVLPFLVTRRWVRERLESWTEQSPQYQARVLGEFPDQPENSLIALRFLEKARESTSEIIDGPLRGGLDCSAGGSTSETVLVLRRGGRIVLIKGWSLPDPIPHVIEALRPYREELASLSVDSIGLGFGFVKSLSENEIGLPIVPVNVSLPATDPERFFNSKAEFYQGLADFFHAGYISNLTDEKTIAQLSSIRTRLTPRGQTRILGKDELRTHVGSGAKFDRGEAMMLAFAETGTGGAIYARSFTDDLIFDAATAPEYSQPSPYRQRYIAVGYGASLPMVFEEILDYEHLIIVNSEFYWDNIKALEPKTDSQFVDDLQKLIAGEDPITGEKFPVDPRNTTVIVRRDEDTENFVLELLRRSIYFMEADVSELIPAIQLVGMLFDKKKVRVSTRCPHMIGESKRFCWDRQKAAAGIEELQSTNKQAVEAFRHWAKTKVNPWRFHL